jgi:hypothetical protein
MNTKGKQALRILQALCKEYGLDYSDYNRLGRASFYEGLGEVELQPVRKLEYYKLVKKVYELEEINKMLLNHLKLEIFEGKEIRKINK